MLQCLAVIFLFAINSIAGYAATTGACADFTLKLPNVTPALCAAAELRDMLSRSVQGRPLWARDVKSPDSRLRVLVVGGMHGDEMSSSALVFHWIGLASTQQQKGSLPVHWRFIPALNPDGLLSRPSRRTNANGVDLNRNFPTPNWARDAPFYWEKRTRKDPRRWPGAKPLSEPESRFLHAQMDSFKPHLIVSVHAPYGVLDFDGPSDPPSRLGRLYLDQVGVFPGSLGNYGGVHKRMPVVTIELPNAMRTPQEAEMRQMWRDLVQWTDERLAPSWVVAR